MEPKQPRPVMEIDLHNLDDILRKFPLEFQQANQNLPELKRLVALAKFNSDTVRAQLYNKIKIKYFRATEAALNAEVQVEPEYLEAYQHYLNVREDYDRAYTVKEQLLHKESALRGLISLVESRYLGTNENIDTDVLQKEWLKPVKS